MICGSGGGGRGGGGTGDRLDAGGGGLAGHNLLIGHRLVNGMVAVSP